MLFLFDFLFILYIHSCQWSTKICYYDFISVTLSLYVYKELLYIFRCLYIVCINVYKVYILLDQPIYHYVVPFVVSYYYFVLKSTLSNMSIIHQIFYFHEIFFSNPLYLVCVSFVLNWVSCRQLIYVGHIFLSIQLSYVF